MGNQQLFISLTHNCQKIKHHVEFLVMDISIFYPFVEFVYFRSKGLQI